MLANLQQKFSFDKPIEHMPSSVFLDVSEKSAHRVLHCSVEQWTVCKLEDLVDVDIENLNAATSRDHKFYYLDISSAAEGRLLLPAAESIFGTAPSRARKVVHRRDVLMSMVRPNLKAFAYFDHTDEHCIASTGFAVLTAKSGVDPRFILYSLLSDGVGRQIGNLVSGSSYPAISSGAVRRLEIHTPPSTEQAKIAEVLSTIDRAIEQTEALITKQHRIKTGLMKDLLTRGIDEQGNIRSESIHQFRNSDLGLIPAEWEIIPVAKLCARVVDCPHSTPNYLDSGIPCIRTADLQPGHLALRGAFCVDEETYRRRVSRLVPLRGDIIYSREGERLGIASPVGNERVCLGQRVMLLRSSQDADPDYLLWAMNAPDFYLRITSGLGSTTSPHINIADVQ